MGKIRYDYILWKEFHNYNVTHWHTLHMYSKHKLLHPFQQKFFKIGQVVPAPFANDFLHMMFLCARVHSLRINISLTFLPSICPNLYQ